MADSDRVKAALAALANDEGDGYTGRGPARLAQKANDGVAQQQTGITDDDYRAVIERATDAVHDIDDAVAFVEADGVGRLETAVSQAEHEVSGLAEEGRAALREFRRYRDAAAGIDGAP